MALVRCTCLAELAPPDDPHERRIVILVADPECGYQPHRAMACA